MKVLFIGGTGTISMAISKKLLLEGHTLYLLNRGSRNNLLKGDVHFITVSDINNEAEVALKIKDFEFDVVVDFFAFVPAQVERDYRLFKNKTKQYVFISSASAYQKPLSDFRINEGTPLSNPYWEYSRNKIACEEFLMGCYRKNGFPVTIVRPSHTYDERSVPLGVHGKNGSYQVILRMLQGKPVIIHGDGTSLWTMTHNSDFAKGFVGLLGNVHAVGESVQITSDESLTWNQIYQTIANKLGVKLNPYFISSSFLTSCCDLDFEGSLIGDKANSVVFDNSKLKRLVPGLCMSKRFDQGVEETLRYVLSHEESQKKDPEFDSWCDRIIGVLEEAKKKMG